MGEEIRRYLLVFVGIPVALVALYSLGHLALTGELPAGLMGDCYTDWDGVANATVCD